jgi:hypothetical protein
MEGEEDLDSIGFDDLSVLGSDLSSLQDPDNVEVWIYENDSGVSSDSHRPTNAKSQELKRGDRKSALLHGPHELQKLMNSGDYAGIHALFDDLFVPNCAFQSRALRGGTINGREKIADICATLINARPDFVLNVHQTVYYRKEGVIISHISDSGTQVFHDTKNGHLYDSLRTGGIGVSEELKAKHRDIESRGGLYRVHMGGRMIWVLNKDRTFVKKFVLDLVATDVREDTRDYREADDSLFGSSILGEL